VRRRAARQPVRTAVAKKGKSAIKAHRQNVKHREHNRQMRGRLRTALKGIRAAADEKNDPGAAKKKLGDAFSLVDKMASKGIIHKNAAGRYKSRLATRIAKASA
jgi:small subunit ribosomal protein S20